MAPPSRTRSSAGWRVWRLLRAKAAGGRAASDGMSVDRGNDGLWVGKDGREHPVQGRQKFPDIGRAAVEQARQVDPGGKNPAFAGNDHRPRGRRAELVEAFSQRLAEFDAHG